MQSFRTTAKVSDNAMISYMDHTRPSIAISDNETTLN